MASSTVPLQGSCSSVPFVPSARSSGSQLKYFFPSLPVCPVGRKDGLISLKCRSTSREEPDVVGCLNLRGGTSFVLGSKSNTFKISAFKGGSRQDDLDGRANGSKSLKDPVKVSYLQHESEESVAESPKVQNGVPVPYTTEDETTTRSLAIQNLFRNWLMLLRAPVGTQQVERALEEPSKETSEEPKYAQKSERLEVLKASWCYFLSLDSIIKIPLLTFAPLYLAVNLVYGSAVTRELTPLWILGPLVTALYVKMLRGIGSLYVFSFKQTARVVKNLPACYMLAHAYLFRGKLKEATVKYLWQPLVAMKNMDYKELTKGVLKIFQGWLVERYLDFVESVWPSYCRTIRFLKRANFI